jgi:hypothetical protein
MNPKMPLLPEATFKPLSEARLESMVNNALSHRQYAAQPNVVNFNSWRKNVAFGSTMAAMAASIMLAFLLTPQYTHVSTITHHATSSEMSADISDLILLDSLES